MYTSEAGVKQTIVDYSDVAWYISFVITLLFTTIERGVEEMITIRNKIREERNSLRAELKESKKEIKQLKRELKNNKRRK